MLKVNEIFASIQGESSFSGLPCTFVRFSGCPLRCRWCDTAYAFEAGESLTQDQILDRVKQLGIMMVELTGGEPLAQTETYELLQKFVASGFKVLLETGGSEPIVSVDPNVHIVLDVKCPGSNMSERNLYKNFETLKATDEIKFVLASRKDYEWAKELIDKYDLAKKHNILISTAFGLVEPKDAVEWMLADRLDARFQLQMHKYVWHPRTKGV